MTRDELVTRIQRILAFRTDRITEIQDALRDTQVEVEAGDLLPWWLQTEVSSITTVIDEERVPVPTDFIREDEDNGGVWYFNSTATVVADQWVLLAKSDIDKLRELLSGAGAPQAYHLGNKYFRMFPTPDAAYTLKMIYFGTQPVMSTNIENEWGKRAHDWMIGLAGQKLVGMRDKVAQAEFIRLEGRGKLRLLKDIEAREHANRRYVMGGLS